MVGNGETSSCANVADIDRSIFAIYEKNIYKEEERMLCLQQNLLIRASILQKTIETAMNTKQAIIMAGYYIKWPSIGNR